MKKTIFLLFAAGVMGGTRLVAQSVDSLRIYDLQRVQVTATRASDKTPMAYSDIQQDEIRTINYGKDVPSLLNMQPSVTMTSDAGTGIGYTGIYIRGTNPTRINVTANGIPLNDSESAQLYWVNMGDFASSLQSIQIQRGVGTSTNGGAAFGATVNMLTESVRRDPYIGFDVSGGTYDTHKETLRFSSGLFSEHWGIQGRFSNIGSNGYIDRAKSRLNSYFIQAGYFGNNTILKFITFNGTEKTYMAWDYASKADMAKYGRTYNPCGIYIDPNGNKTYYSNQTDNYHQQHYQLLLNQRINRQWNFNVALHYTRGDGYYEQYKVDQKLYKYLVTGGLQADVVRQQHMLNDFFGTVFSVNYDNEKNLTATVGGGWNKYDGDHFGRLIWVGSQYYWDDDKNQVFSNVGNNLDADHEYYRNNARKTDGNIYGKLNYEFVRGLNGFVDLQYRFVGYKMSGTSKEFDDNKKQRPLVLDRHYDFFNPKFGITYNFLRHHTAYASYAIAHREPTRNDFEEMLAETDEVDPQQERLNDLEVGYRYDSKTFSFGANFYYMKYKNQFVLTGAQDSNGEMVARNIKDTYRMGVELQAEWRPFKGFLWNVNATWSSNRAKNMHVTVINDDWTQSYANVGTTKLAYSPDLILANRLSYEWKGLRASLMTKYISKQYMTNSGFKSYLENDGSRTSAMIDAIFVSDLDLSYTFSMPYVKSATVGVTVYNLFNHEYESNGSCSMNFRRNSAGNIEAYNGGWAWTTYSAQAPTHFLAHLSLNF